MRKIKLSEDLVAQNPELWKLKDTYLSDRREYRLITPLFGGGAYPRYADEITVIRPSEIKGQLRFWWRAVRGWKANGDLQKLLKTEEEIWGGVTEVSNASKVVLEIEVLDQGKDETPYIEVPDKKDPRKKRFRNRSEIAPAYVAFPLQPTKDDRTLYPVRLDVRFALTLTYPESIHEDVEAALWAWETFGGLGARTRRGFGAVVAEENLKHPLNKLDQIRKKLEAYIKGGNWPQHVPYLTPESTLYLFPGSWQKLVGKYQDFRQWRDGPRGRSKWPEPDAIREFTKPHSYGHKPRHPVQKFPRGQFGLPIIFHFKGEEDPADATLKGESLERHASPLGFKPLGAGKNGPVLIYVLEGSRFLPEPYTLHTDRGPFNVDVTLTPDEARQIEPLEAAGGEPDPIKAFIKWLKTGGKR